jgi:LuxR family maltose regulon positive regulatory protein
VKSALARLWIAQGNLEIASHLVQQCSISTAGSSVDPEIRLLHEPGYFALLRFHIASGEHDVALRLSERMLHKAETADQNGRVIEILALRALAYQGKNNTIHALATMERAITLAQPEGYVRTFLDEGEAMLRLLKACRLRVEGLSKQYIEALLLATYGQKSEQPDLHPSTAPAETLIEPLTQRELEVLKLIESGCANQEIADQLVISITTVKRHISNIYAKLGVTSRTQAIARGRLLKLFE